MRRHFYLVAILFYNNLFVIGLFWFTEHASHMNQIKLTNQIEDNIGDLTSKLFRQVCVHLFFTSVCGSGHVRQ